MRLEPVFALAFIQHNLQRTQTYRDQTQSDVIDFCFRKFLALRVRRVLDEARGQHQRKNAHGNVQQKDPAPGEIIGNPAAQSRTDSRRHHHSDSVHCESHAALRGRKSIGQNSLLAGLQSASARALQYAKENQHAQIGRQSAEQRTDGEDGHAAHVETLAPNDGRDPAAERQHNGIRNQIGSQDPCALIGPCGKAPCDVRQGHVGDAGIQHLHESGQRDRQRDDPGIDRRTRESRAIRGQCRAVHRPRIHLTQTLGSTDMPGRRMCSLVSPGSKVIFTGIRCTTLT